MPDLIVSGNVDTMLGAADNAGIRSAIGLGQTDAPTFLAQSLTGQSLTGTQSTSLVDLATTWNTTGTPSALKLNVTDTASNAASNLMDFQIGGVSKLKINKAGDLVNPTWTLGALGGGHYGFFGSTNGAFLFLNPANQRGVWVTNSPEGFVTQIYNSLLKISGLGTNFTTLLTSDAAGILAQRNGTAKQTLRIYNTYTSATVYERAVMDYNGPTPNTLRIGTEFLGAGMAANPVDVVVGGVARISIAAIGTITTSSAAFVIGGDTYLNGVSFAALRGTGAGVALISNTSFSDFNRLQLGGTTSAFPAIKRFTTGLQARLADDSAFTNIQGKLTTDTAYTGTVVVPTGFLTLYDSTGQAYRVPCVV
jgi:hypothetical protein